MSRTASIEKKIEQFRAIREIARRGLLNNIIETQDWDKLPKCMGIFDAETEKLIREYRERVGG